MTVIDPDHLLMARVARQDHAAYRMLMAKHAPRCMKIAERMLGNRQDAEEVTQETCYKVWAEAPRWEARAKFSTWVYRIVVNACLDRKRRLMPRVELAMELLADEGIAADEAMMQLQQARLLQHALHRLPERQRAAIVLSYYEEFSNQDAADMLGMKLGAFQQLIFRARQGLKHELQHHKKMEQYDERRLGS